jgi:hydrogenase nickel incorporation protein HypA/HybF
MDMHELSIAMSIVEMAQEEAEQRGGVQVTAVHLKLGALSGVVKDALLSAYEMARDDTPLQGRVWSSKRFLSWSCARAARRSVRSVPFSYFAVPNVATPTSEVMQGKELEVVALEIEEWAHNPA